MITASCQFCEDIRKEANGQETLVGVFDHANPIIQERYLTRLYANVTIHVPFDDKVEQFGVKVGVPSQPDSELALPSPELVDEVFQASVKLGRQFAIFPVAIGLLAAPVAVTEKLQWKVFLVIDGVETLIGVFTAVPPEESDD